MKHIDELVLFTTFKENKIGDTYLSFTLCNGMHLAHVPYRDNCCSHVLIVGRIVYFSLHYHRCSPLCA